MCELWEGETEITLKPQSENGQETKVPGPTQELNLPWLRHDFSFSVSFFKRASRQFKDVILLVLVLKCVTMYQQHSSNSITILLGLQYTDSVVTKPIQLYTRTTGKQEYLDQYIWTDIKEKRKRKKKIKAPTAPQNCEKILNDWICGHPPHIVCNYLILF